LTSLDTDQIAQAFEAGGMGFKSWADQIFYTLSATHHHCKIEVWTLA